MVLPRLRTGGTLLDLGSCLGQDIRKCIVDGAPAEQIFASDLFPEYEDLAYNFWRDRDKIPADHFIADNILADNDDFVTGPLMTRFGPGQIDIISITMFLHLFDYLNQLKTAARLLRLLSHKPGSMIVGSQAGSIIAGEQPLKPPFDGTESGTRRTVFRHNPSSFERLWKKASRAAGVPLKVSAVLQAPEEFPDGVDSGFDFATKLRRFRTGTQTRRLYFSIMRT
ncbi:MAG: hypothetical protein Q9214_001059 [Letrouitia sp. 1 TL-2023]